MSRMSTFVLVQLLLACTIGNVIVSYPRQVTQSPFSKEKQLCLNSSHYLSSPNFFLRSNSMNHTNGICNLFPCLPNGFTWLCSRSNLIQRSFAILGETAGKITGRGLIQGLHPLAWELHLKLIAQALAWGAWQPCLCLATCLTDPVLNCDLVTCFSALTSDLPHCFRLVW